MRREVIECDRCGEDAAGARDSNGRLYAATLSGRDVIGTSERPADLCGDCMADLATFMQSPAVKQESA